MRYDREMIPNNDLLKAIVNRTTFKRLPTTIGINAEGQIGKSTVVFWYANRIEAILRYGNNWVNHRDEWNLWDYKKYCSTDLEQFVELYDASWGKTIVLEEAADQGMDTTSYFDMFSRTYARISRTQGVHLNRTFLITPFLNDLLKVHKRKINYVVAIKMKDTVNKRALLSWRKVRVNNLILKEDNIECKWRRDILLSYTNRFLKASNEYIEWLKGFKRSIMDSIKHDVQKDTERKKEKVRLENYDQWVQESSKTPLKVRIDKDFY